VEHTLYGAETWTLWKVDKKYLERFGNVVLRKVEISWADRVRNEILLKVKEKKNILYTTERGKAKWIRLRRNCLLKHIIEGNLAGCRLDTPDT
jgi:hypothetical protein